MHTSNRLELLTRDRIGQWSIRVSDRWRICFRFENSTENQHVQARTAPNSPGKYLIEILDALNISQARFARAIGVSPMRIPHVIKGVRPVIAELALLFGRAFNQSPQYWLNLQATYDLKIAEASLGKLLNDIHSLAHA